MPKIKWNEKNKFFATPKGKILLAILFGIPSAITVSLCLKQFWLAQISIKALILVGLTLVFSLFYWLLLAAIRLSAIKGSATKLTLLFLLITILAPTGLLYSLIKTQFLILSPTRVDVALSSQTTKPARLLISSASLLSSERTIAPVQYSHDCEIQMGEISVAAGKSCSVTYLVSIYEADRIEIVFDPSQSDGIVEVSTPMGGDRYLFTSQSTGGTRDRFAVNLNWVPNQIELFASLLLGFSLFCLLALVCLSLWTLIDNRPTKVSQGKPTGEGWIFLLFVLVALIYANVRFGAGFNQTLKMTSDAGNISSYVGGLENPQYFTEDELLNNPANFGEYLAVHIPLIYSLSKLTGGYASAFMVLIAPVTLLHLCGYYLVGKKLLGNRLVALAFVVATAIPIDLPLFEYFGLSDDILPRSLFQALLPFALLLLISKGQNPKLHWLISLAFTLLLYVHPVSGPAWVAVCLATLLYFAITVNGKNWWKSWLPALLVFVIGVIPFLQAYLGQMVELKVSLELLQQIQQHRYASQRKPIVAFYLDDMLGLFRANWALITLVLVGLGFGVSGLIRIIRRSKKMATHKVSRQSVLLLIWWVVLIAVAVLIPFLDEAIASAFDRNLVLREIRRTLRYFIPMLWLTFFWVCQKVLVAFGELRESAKSRLLVGVAIVSLLTSYSVETKAWKNSIFIRHWECIRSGNLICKPDQETLAMHEFYTELRKYVDIDESVFPDPSPQYLSETLIPRYHSLRSVAYSYKDGGALGEFLPEWWQITQALKPYLPPITPSLDPKVVEVARTTVAEYFYFIHPDETALEYLKTQDIVFQNEYGTLISLK